MAAHIMNIMIYITLLSWISTESFVQTDEQEYTNTEKFDSLTTEAGFTTDLNLQTFTNTPETTTLANNSIISNETDESVSDEYWYEDYYYYYDYEYEIPSPDTDFEGETCQKNWRCDGTFPPVRQCYCDNLCVTYGDCCHNANVTRYDGIKNTSFSCQYLPTIHGLWFIFVVDTCPDGTDYQLGELCADTNNKGNIYRMTPVSSLSTGILYKNMHCAICNGVFDYIFWRAKLRCEWTSKDHLTFGNMTFKEMFFRDDCFMFDLPPLDNITYRQCYPHINSCPENTYESTTLSSQYIENNDTDCETGDNKYVFTSYEIYKNPSCYECNTGVKTNDSEVTCSRSDFNLTQRLTNKYRGPYSLVMLFNLGTQELAVYRKEFRTRTVEVASFSGRCGEDEGYDPFNEQCKMLCDTKFDNCTESYTNSQIDIEPNCSYVTFNQSGFELMNNTNLRHIATGKQYGNFRLINSSVIICIEKGPYFRRLKNVIDLDDIFHMTTNGISMLSLVATIFILVHTSFHKLPSKFLLCLALSLLIAQSCLLLGPVAEDNIVCCKIAALVMHYSFMTSFTWMNVIAYDVYYSFARHFEHSAQRDGIWLLKYSMYAWLAPLALVTAAFMTDEFSSWKYGPKYADPTCWINNSNGLLVFFLVPLALIMMTNMFFFAMSFRNICMTYRTKLGDIPKRKPDQIYIYIKLSIIMGLTWVFGFLGNVVRNEIFWTFFVICNGLQGLFIFLGFAMKPLFNMLRNRKKNVRKRFSTKYITMTSHAFWIE